MKNTTLKQKLKKNELTIGSWITIGHPTVAEIMSSAGFEWLTIDMEHNSIDPSMMQTLIATIQANDVAALVRVAKNEEVAIKHAMDAGADGVIVPMINTKEDALKAVNYVKYPPEGKRGVGLSRAQKYGSGFDEYKNWLRDHSVVIAQIEHVDGINALETITQTSGIDGIIVGPYDLSGSLGFPGKYEILEVKNALDKIELYCKSNNYPMGFHVVPPDTKLLNQKIELGYKLIALSTDFYFLSNGAVSIMENI